MVACGAAKSKGDARRLIEGGGIRVNDDKISALDYKVDEKLAESGFVLHKGKKVHIKIEF